MNRPLNPNDIRNIPQQGIRQTTRQVVPSQGQPQPQQQGQAPRLRATPPAMPRRAVEMGGGVGTVRRPDNAPTPQRFPQQKGRRMVVAKDITLSGQISKCDHLVVEGCVEGMRYDGQSLQVEDGGSFNGTIEVENAEISGIYDGTMTVRGQLIIRGTGRITGSVQYGDLEVNSGGQINGELKSMGTKRDSSVHFESMFGDSDHSDDESESTPIAAIGE